MDRIVRVDPFYPGAWETLRPYLADALEKGGGGRDWLPVHIRECATNGRADLFALVSEDKVFGALVTATVVYPRRKVLDILVLGTDPGAESKWLPLFDQMKVTAKAQGFDTITGTGRPGWARKLGAAERKVFEVEL